MMDIIVRKIPKKTIAELDELAAQNNQSREEYIRRLLSHHVMYVEAEKTYQAPQAPPSIYQGEV
ncbi:CopG family transcriptional regulator [Enterococcus hirae]|nr:CopG family transcriptional regulator [Enterococcus hirae]EMF0427075.1 CopG family transcriptional regulator [Enterococcus hirae]EMF0618068.1 CopG family transcriptional regulator [Enterococcus hirae]